MTIELIPFLLGVATVLILGFVLGLVYEFWKDRQFWKNL